ncbi:Phosphoglycolate phosphatase-like HAD superfamily hydrolase [Azospirillaceae bacterium]
MGCNIMTVSYRRLSALFFDFDGVILESADIKTAAFEALFASVPEHLPQIVSLHRRLGGVSRYEKFSMIHRDILRVPFSDAERIMLGERFSALIADALRFCPMVPGVLMALETLQRYKIPFFVVSGTPQEELEELCAQRDLTRFFVEIHGSPRTKIEILSDILARFGLRATETAMIGDAMTDYEAARAVGARFIGRRKCPEISPFPLGTMVLDDFFELENALFDEEHCIPKR